MAGSRWLVFLLQAGYRPHFVRRHFPGLLFVFRRSLGCSNRAMHAHVGGSPRRNFQHAVQLLVGPLHQRLHRSHMQGITTFFSGDHSAQIKMIAVQKGLALCLKLRVAVPVAWDLDCLVAPPIAPAMSRRGAKVTRQLFPTG